MSGYELSELRNKIGKIKAIIERYGIDDAETIWQSDEINDDSPQIIQESCEIVGYVDGDEN
jgi:hypothetical protein